MIIYKYISLFFVFSITCIISENINAATLTSVDSCYFEEFKEDTVLRNNNDEIEIKITNEKDGNNYVENDGYYYCDCIYHIQIFNKNKLIISKDLQKKDFISIIDADFYKIANLNIVTFLEKTNEEFVFLISFGKPDSDVADVAHYYISEHGKERFEWIDQSFEE